MVKKLTNRYSLRSHHPLSHSLQSFYHTFTATNTLSNIPGICKYALNDTRAILRDPVRVSPIGILKAMAKDVGRNAFERSEGESLKEMWRELVNLVVELETPIQDDACMRSDMSEKDDSEDDGD